YYRAAVSLSSSLLSSPLPPRGPTRVIVVVVVATTTAQTDSRHRRCCRRHYHRAAGVAPPCIPRAAPMAGIAICRIRWLRRSRDLAMFADAPPRAARHRHFVARRLITALTPARTLHFDFDWFGSRRREGARSHQHDIGLPDAPPWSDCSQGSGANARSRSRWISRPKMPLALCERSPPCSLPRWVSMANQRLYRRRPDRPRPAHRAAPHRAAHRAGRTSPSAHRAGRTSRRLDIAPPAHRAMGNHPPQMGQLRAQDVCSFPGLRNIIKKLLSILVRGSGLWGVAKRTVSPG